MTLAIALMRLLALIALGAIGANLILAGRQAVSRRLILAGTLIALSATALQVMLQAALAGGDAGLTWGLLEIFLLKTWGGKVALVRLVLISAILAVGLRRAGACARACCGGLADCTAGRACEYRNSCNHILHLPRTCM